MLRKLSCSSDSRSRDAVMRGAEPIRDAVDVYSRKRRAEFEADDDCSSVSLDLLCGSSSFDGEECRTEAEVSDLVLPRILRTRPVSPYNFQPLAALHSACELAGCRRSGCIARTGRSLDIN